MGVSLISKKIIIFDTKYELPHCSMVKQQFLILVTKGLDYYIKYLLPFSIQLLKGIVKYRLSEKYQPLTLYSSQQQVFFNFSRF